MADATLAVEGGKPFRTPRLASARPRPSLQKPSIQALERAQGSLKLPNGRALTGFSHECKRHGTTTLFAAPDTATGLVKGGHYKRRRRPSSWVS